MSNVTDAIRKREAKLASRKKAEKAKAKPAPKAEPEKTEG